MGTKATTDQCASHTDCLVNSDIIKLACTLRHKLTRIYETSGAGHFLFTLCYLLKCTYGEDEKKQWPKNKKQQHIAATT